VYLQGMSIVEMQQAGKTTRNVCDIAGGFWEWAATVCDVGLQALHGILWLKKGFYNWSEVIALKVVFLKAVHIIK
jgi:hypothetical protein